MDQANKWLDLSGKVVIVTGGSMGLGEKMVENLSANGANVVYADLAPNQSFNEMEGITFIKCDVTKKTQVEALTIKSKSSSLSSYSGIAGRSSSDGRTAVRRHY